MANPAQSVIRLWQVSDTHCYASDDARLEWVEEAIFPNRNLRAVLEYLGQVEAYSALILSGDLVQEETELSYRRINTLLQAFPLPVYALPGNHDIPALMQTCLDGNVSVPEQVSFGVWHCLLLDTHSPGKPGGYLDEAQLQRLESLLQGIPEGHFTLIFMHHHPLAIGSAWMDVMGLQEAERFWAVVERFPTVRAVFNGHIHQEFAGQHTFPNGRSVPVWGTPATCVQLKALNPVFAFDHTRPAWRDITLFPDGTLETAVHYLTL